MNKNDELKFEEIKKGVMKSSKLPQGSYVTIVEKMPPEKKEKIEKKKNKDIRKIAIALIFYLIINNLISTLAIKQKYEITNDDYVRVGSDYHLTEEAKNKIPDGAFAEEFIDNLNPINLIDTTTEVIKNSRN